MNLQPRDGKTYDAAFLLTGEKPKPGENPRLALARMVTSHPQFRRAAVNILWGKLMTVAFVEPYDGFDLARLDPKNPPPAPWTLQPTNPELLQAMADDFGQHNYSLQHVVKTIMKSSAYQLSSQFEGEWKSSYAPYYARHLVRVLTGPEIIDALTEATGRPGDFDNGGKKFARVKQETEPRICEAAGRGVRAFECGDSQITHRRSAEAPLRRSISWSSHFNRAAIHSFICAKSSSNVSRPGYCPSRARQRSALCFAASPSAAAFSSIMPQMLWTENCRARSCFQRAENCLQYSGLLNSRSNKWFESHALVPTRLPSQLRPKVAS